MVHSRASVATSGRFSKLLFKLAHLTRRPSLRGVRALHRARGDRRRLQSPRGSAPDDVPAGALDRLPKNRG